MSTDATWRVIIDQARAALRPGAPTPRPRDLPPGPIAPAAPPSDYFAPTPRPVTHHDGAGAVLDAIATLIRTNLALLTEFHGHGNHTRPPTGALTYRPTAALGRAVMARYPTCTHPNCDTPAQHCQIDHAAPFNHDNPARGGWTIPENLHPRCLFHHQLHTLGHHRIVILDDGAVITISRTGVLGITLPDTSHSHHTTEPPPQPQPAWDTTTTPPPPEPDDPIYHPTWWETHMHPNDTPPTPHQIATITDPEHRTQCHHLRHHYHQHHAILTAREHHRPPPF